MTVQRLTEVAQSDRDEFDALDDCCSCHLHPPCGYCTHPGNPMNQDENEECWEIAGDLNEELWLRHKLTL